MEILKCREK